MTITIDNEDTDFACNRLDKCHDQPYLAMPAKYRTGVNRAIVVLSHTIVIAQN
jgi:hypothetical protein